MIKLYATVDTGPRPDVMMRLEIHADTAEDIPRLQELCEQFHMIPVVPTVRMMPDGDAIAITFRV